MTDPRTTHEANAAGDPAVSTSGVATTTNHPTRLVGPDVARAVALIGVVVMNYHGYLNGGGASAGLGAGWAARLFDPWHGILSTRFAATFVTIAGISVVLFTNRSRTSGDRAAITNDRWRLVRRGVILASVGFVLDWIWPGTILYFYGAYFIVASMLFTLRDRTLAVIGAAAAFAAAAIQWWTAVQIRDGKPPSWLSSPQTLATRSPRGLLLDTFVNGTHPLLPWLAFLCIGMILGRHLGELPKLLLAALGTAATLATYLVNHLFSSDERGAFEHIVRDTVLSTRPFDRGLLYVIGTAGTAVAAFCLLSMLAERFEGRAPIELLRRAGQMTLSIYVLHVLVFNVIVDRLRWVGGTGLDTALVFAVVFWVLAIVSAAWWQKWVGRGPLENLYRRFSG